MKNISPWCSWWSPNSRTFKAQMCDRKWTKKSQFDLSKQIQWSRNLLSVNCWNGREKELWKSSRPLLGDVWLKSKECLKLTIQNLQPCCWEANPSRDTRDGFPKRFWADSGEWHIWFTGRLQRSFPIHPWIFNILRVCLWPRKPGIIHRHGGATDQICLL